jgi:hypothetical protein
LSGNRCSVTIFTVDNNISLHEIVQAIDSFKTGKAAGPDGLSAEHFKYTGNRLAILLSLVFSCINSHGYIPNSFMQSIIIPLIKDKSGDIIDIIIDQLLCLH